MWPDGLYVCDHKVVKLTSVMKKSYRDRIISLPKGDSQFIHVVSAAPVSGMGDFPFSSKP